MLRASLTRASFFILCFAATLVAQKMHHGKDHPNPHHQRSAQEWIEILEQPERDDWQKPGAVVDALALEPGLDIADIGAGTGYFSVPLAKRVAPDGKVYAVDVQQDLMDHLAERSMAEMVLNLKPVLGKYDDPLLPPASVDLIFICDVVHHIEDRQAYYTKLAQALRPEGRIAVIDFYKRDQPVGPSKKVKIAKSDMIAEFQEAGFRLAGEHDFLPYQYFLIFSR